MSARTATILGRFPRHLEADAPGKVFGWTVDALSRDLDTQTGQLGEIRGAHRLGDAPTTTDIVRLGGVHGIGSAALTLLQLRIDAIRPVSTALADPTADADATDAAIDLLADLVNVDPAGFVDAADGTDPVPGRVRLGNSLSALDRFENQLAAHRDVVRGVIATHRSGNGTSPGLLNAAATYLGLGVVGAVTHAEDNWWHLAQCDDRLAPTPLNPPDVPVRDLLALEENPPQPMDVGPTPRVHATRFAILRGGLEAVPVTVVVEGIEDRTAGPMIVNVNTGSGVAFEGVVPDRSQLRFFGDGRVELDGASVLAQAFSFRGAIFADELAPIPTIDFVLAPDDDVSDDPPRAVEGILSDRTAHWSVTEPVQDAFASDGAFPHAEGLLEPVWLARGRTRWAVFVAAGVYALRFRSNGRIRNAAPRFDAAFFDRSVFEPDPPPLSAPSLGVGFEWLEREAFAARMWIPARFATLDRDGEMATNQRLRTLLDRHRAAGIRLTVEYADPRWTLGTGIVRRLDSTDPLGLVVSGTTTWPPETEQPEPD